MLIVYKHFLTLCPNVTRMLPFSGSDYCRADICIDILEEIYFCSVSRCRNAVYKLTTDSSTLDISDVTCYC
jgi:hypothetical protein